MAVNFIKGGRIGNREIKASSVGRDLKSKVSPTFLALNLATPVPPKCRHRFANRISDDTEEAAGVSH
jgi:hypothetical protein